MLLYDSDKFRVLYNYAENCSVSEMVLNICHDYYNLIFTNLSLLGQCHNKRLKAFLCALHLV